MARDAEGSSARRRAAIRKPHPREGFRFAGSDQRTPDVQGSVSVERSTACTEILDPLARDDWRVLGREMLGITALSLRGWRAYPDPVWILDIESRVLGIV